MAGLRRRTAKAFTLMEVIVATAILSVLAAIALPEVTDMFDQVSSSSDAILLEGSFVEARRIAALQAYHNTYPDPVELVSQMRGLEKAYTVNASTNSSTVSVWSNGDSGNELVLAAKTTDGQCIVLYDNMTSGSEKKWAKDSNTSSTCDATTAAGQRGSIDGTRSKPKNINL